MWRREVVERKSKNRSRPLPPVTAILWSRFAFSSRRERWFKPDWAIFYDFVRHCHDRRVKLTPTDVLYLLQDEGVVPDGAKQIAEVYQHCRAVLATRYRCPLNLYDFSG